jgi:hypothetical protein
MKRHSQQKPGMPAGCTRCKGRPWVAAAGGMARCDCPRGVWYLTASPLGIRIESDCLGEAATPKAHGHGPGTLIYIAVVSQEPPAPHIGNRIASDLTDLFAANADCHSAVGLDMESSQWSILDSASKDAVFSVAWNPDGKTLASTESDVAICKPQSPVAPVFRFCVDVSARDRNLDCLPAAPDRWRYGPVGRGKFALAELAEKGA